MKTARRSAVLLAALVVPMFHGVSAQAQELLPVDNGLTDYHVSPRWRESEAHPIRILAYAVHPIGWALREVIFRPISYFASSSEVNRSVFGYREPRDWKSPDCFSADVGVPDCKTIVPFNYGGEGIVGNSNRAGSTNRSASNAAEIYFPNVNFNFNSRGLSPEGQKAVEGIAQTLKGHSRVNVVLEGHTDYLGGKGYNHRLGMDRANAVRSALEGMGIEADRLSTVSFGELHPLDPAKTASARATNRRVEVKSK